MMVMTAAVTMEVSLLMSYGESERLHRRRFDAAYPSPKLVRSLHGLSLANQAHPGSDKDCLLPVPCLKFPKYCVSVGPDRLKATAALIGKVFRRLTTRQALKDRELRPGQRSTGRFACYLPESSIE